MSQAALLLSSSDATLRSSFRSLFNNGVAVYPDTEFVEVEGSSPRAVIASATKQSEGSLNTAIINI